ncbi:MAG: MgtC/SapB family protein [Candidatus Aenigmatarchaeota archaeon]|nr:MAG: MgtC/SapB family protein [Candidatus Aenigmarchaeota archaeon]
MPLEFYEVLLRVGLTFLLSLMFGLERQIRKKPVGFGTFALVATGCSVLTVVATELGGSPVIVVGGIITGIGFLGAGSLLRYQDKVFGFTTAASIWASAVFGVSMGAGMFAEGLLLYFFIAVVMVIDAYFERIGFGRYAKMITVTASGAGTIERVRRMLPKKSVYMESSFRVKGGEYTATFMSSGSSEEIRALPGKLKNAKGVKNFSIK